MTETKEEPRRVTEAPRGTTKRKKGTSEPPNSLHLDALRPYLASTGPDEAGEWKARCPLHDDHRPSASFNFKKGVWNCQGCEGSGKISNLTYLLKLEAECHDVREGDDRAYRLKLEAECNQRVDDLPTDADLEAWHAALIDSPSKMPYLTQERGLSAISVQNSELGWVQRWKQQRECFAIPIRNAAGELVAVRFHRPGGDPKYWGIKGRNQARLYPLSALAAHHKEVVLTEGVFDALCVKDRGFNAVCHTGSVSTWNSEWNRLFANKVVYICFDRDKAGVAGAEKVAKQLANFAKEVRVVELPYPVTEKGGKDLTDFLAKEGKANHELDALLEAAEVREPDEAAEAGEQNDKPRTFRLLSEQEVVDLPEPEWLVEDLLIDGSLADLFGPSGGGKTFLALDLSLSVSTGETWHGRKVKAGPVIYILAEGVGGFGKRIVAWRQMNSRTGASRGFYVLSASIDLQSPDDIEALQNTIREMSVFPVMIVIDTYARSHTGDENSTKDTSRVIRNLDRLRAEFNSCVWVVHHTGNDGDKERGNSALRSAMDTAMSFKPTGAGYQILHNDKQKDHDEFEDICFSRLKLESVNSCVLKVHLGSDGQKISLSQTHHDRIIEVIEEAKKPLTQSAISKMTGWNPIDTRKRLDDAVTDSQCPVYTQPGKRENSLLYTLNFLTEKSEVF